MIALLNFKTSHCSEAIAAMVPSPGHCSEGPNLITSLKSYAVIFQSFSSCEDPERKQLKKKAIILK